MGKQQEPEYEVQYINNHKIVAGKNKKKQLLFEIKWKGYPASENTWEPSESTENAKDLVDQYWAIKGGGKEERMRCEKILKGEISPNEKGKKVDKENEEEEPRKSRSSKNKAVPTSSKKNETSSKRRRVEVEESEDEEKKKKIEYSSDSENDDFSESEIEKENFRVKSNWKTDVAKVIEVRNVTKDDGKKELHGLLRWRDGKLAMYKTTEISKRVPQKLIKYYENKLSFELK